MLTEQETMSIIHSMDGVPKLVVSLLYGSELRISDALRLRIQDLDLDYKQMAVRNGKGLRDRITMIPESRIDQIRHHIQKVKNLHNLDLEKGFGETILPKALTRKYPNAAKNLFDGSICSRLKKICRPSVRCPPSLSCITTEYQAGGKKGSERTSQTKTCDPPHLSTLLCNSFIEQRLRYPNRIGIAWSYERKTTRVYIHVINKGGRGVKSPLDRSS